MIALVCALLGGLYARFWTAPQTAAAFEVRYGTGVVGRYALNENRHLRIKGQQGISELEVKDGRVRFVQSPCRNKICVHSGWLAHAGDATACLPNRVSITLLGEYGPEFDAVSF